MSKYFSNNIDYALTLNYEDAKEYVTKTYLLNSDRGDLDDIAEVSEYKDQKVMQFFHVKDNEIESVRFKMENNKWVETEYQVNVLKRNE